MSNRLPDSKRNEVIDKFREGIEDPEYEVIPSKTVKGKYTVRRRKEVKIETPKEPAVSTQPEVEEEEANEDVPPPMPKPKRGRSSGVDPNQLFYEYQTQLNRMMIENMKMMRQQVKAAERKRIKQKDKTRKYFNILDSVANEVEQAQRAREEQEIPESWQPPEQTEEEEQIERPPKAEPSDDGLEDEKPAEFDYQAAVDDMAGLAPASTSRRNRLKTERFGI